MEERILRLQGQLDDLRLCLDPAERQRRAVQEQERKRVFNRASHGVLQVPGLDVRPGDDLILHQRAGLTVRDHILNAHGVDEATLESRISEDRRIFDDREDWFVANIADRNEPFVATVWGALHDMRNNVLEHNARRPDRAISLIVITPQTLVDAEALEAARKR